MEETEQPMLCSQAATDLTGHNPENPLRGFQMPITKTSTAGELKFKNSYTAKQKKDLFSTNRSFPSVGTTEGVRKGWDMHLTLWLCDGLCKFRPHLTWHWQNPDTSGANKHCCKGTDCSTAHCNREHAVPQTDTRGRKRTKSWNRRCFLVGKLHKGATTHPSKRLNNLWAEYMVQIFPVQNKPRMIKEFFTQFTKWENCSEEWEVQREKINLKTRH